MTKNFSATNKLLLIFILAVFIYLMMKISYGWSIDQTALFMSAVVGVEYATPASWFIQFAPQALWVVAGYALAQHNKPLGYGMIFSGLLFNGIDMLTNILAFHESWPQFSANITFIQDPNVLRAARGFGYAFACGVTFFEELIMLCTGAIISLFVEFSNGMGWRTSPLLSRLGATAYNAGGWTGATSNQRSGRVRSRPAQPTQQPMAASSRNNNGGRR